MMGMGRFPAVRHFVGPRATPTIHTKATKHWMAGDRTRYLPETLPFEYEDFHKAFKASVQKIQTKAFKRHRKTPLGMGTDLRFVPPTQRRNQHKSRRSNRQKHRKEKENRSTRTRSNRCKRNASRKTGGIPQNPSTVRR